MGAECEGYGESDICDGDCDSCFESEKKVGKKPSGKQLRTLNVKNKKGRF